MHAYSQDRKCSNRINKYQNRNLFYFILYFTYQKNPHSFQMVQFGEIRTKEYGFLITVFKTYNLIENLDESNIEVALQSQDSLDHDQFGA